MRGPQRGSPAGVLDPVRIADNHYHGRQAQSPARPSRANDSKPPNHPFPVNLPVGKIHYIEAE
jgi:hypothetical protein